MKAFKLIQRTSENRALQNKINRLKKMKFEIFLSRLVVSIEKTITKNKRSGLGLVRMILAVPNSLNSRLNKIKQLKGKISGEARKIETKLSKSMSAKERIRFGVGKNRIDFGVSRPRQTINNYGSFLVDKENRIQTQTIDQENRMLEISIKQTEKFIYQFIKDVSKDMINVEQSEFQEKKEKERHFGIKNKEK